MLETRTQLLFPHCQQWQKKKLCFKWHFRSHGGLPAGWFQILDFLGLDMVRFRHCHFWERNLLSYSLYWYSKYILFNDLFVYMLLRHTACDYILLSLVSGGDIRTTSTSPSAPWATHRNIWNVQRPFWGALLQDLQQNWWKQSKSKVCSLKSEGFTLGSSLSNFFFSLTSEVNQRYHRMSKRNDNPNGSYRLYLRKTSTIQQFSKIKIIQVDKRETVSPNFT